MRCLPVYEFLASGTHFDRTDRNGESREPKDPPFAELLIDCEEDRTLRAVLVGMLRERQQ